MRRPRRQPGGFTLPLTIMLSMVLSLLAMAVIMKVTTGLNRASHEKSRQAAMDAAQIGLTMAIDEITPGIERMRNAVWSGTVDTGMGAPYPQPGRTQPMLINNATSDANPPVHELSLFGNIRNWEAFADWTQPYAPLDPDYTTWGKGWVFVPDDETRQYFDDSENPKKPVEVGNVQTTGHYWYTQIDPLPPNTPDTSAPPPTWKNKTIEYPAGLFWQPVLKKVYTVQENPKVRVAIFVRMSLQDYCGPAMDGYPNRALDGWSHRRRFSLPLPTGFNGDNYKSTNLVTFSIFAVSESTTLARGTRIHQALNVAMGGAEYAVSGGGDLSPLEDNDRLFEARAGSPSYNFYSLPAFAPALDTPAGDSRLVAFTPITGQVYPASADLSFSFRGLNATSRVVFLYEVVWMGTSHVVFLIEQMPKGINGNAEPYWRRRLLYDRIAPTAWQDTVWGNTGDEPINYNYASYSIPDSGIAPGNAQEILCHDALFPSMLWWANKRLWAPPVPAPFTQQLFFPPDWHVYNAINFPVEDHFNLRPGGNPFIAGDITANRYPYSAVIADVNEALPDRESFRIGVKGSTVNGKAGNVVSWSGNPLMKKPPAGSPNACVRADAFMPWEGPTKALPGSGARVSYYITNWPYMTYSMLWTLQGGALSLPYDTATWSVK